MIPLAALALALAAAPAVASATPGALAPATAPQVTATEQPVDPYVQSDANAGATPLASRATFEAFHGREGVQRISDDFVARDLKDPRIKDAFAAADTIRLRRVFAEQLCYLLDGGCAYTGRDMRESHRGMGLQTSDFNAVVENLQHAMDDEHVPFRAQNVLLAKLAPMQRTVVERTSPAMLKDLRHQLASLRTGR